MAKSTSKSKSKPTRPSRPAASKSKGKAGAKPARDTKATRAERAAAKRRSDAAKRGAETRRKNAAREARQTARLIREQEAARARVEKRDAAAAKKAARAARKAELERVARKAAARPVQWEVALERIRGHIAAIAGDADLRVDVAPRASKGQPWQVRATIRPDTGMAYEALNEALAAVERDRDVERYIGPNRYTRIAVTYTGPESRGSSREVTRPWTVAEISPWETTISRAVEQTDPEAPDSPASRYRYTSIEAIELWISGGEADAVPF